MVSENQNINPAISADPDVNSSPEQTHPPDQSFPKKAILIFLGLIIAILLVGGIYISTQKSQKSELKIAQTPSPTPIKTESQQNLNPNTGNLYVDIKVRLNEVIR